MIKRIIVLTCLLSLGTIVKGQQIEQFSMYMDNLFLVNPAEAGTEKFIDLKLGYRSQWSGLDGAPRTFFFSGHTPLHKISDDFDDTKPLPFHGAGLAVIGDVIGPFSRTTAKAAYAYHLPVGKDDFFLSFGAHLGFQQYQLDLSQLRAGNGSTNAVFDVTSGALDKSIVPDLSFGIWGYGDRLYFGVASFQLIPSKVKVTQGLEDDPNNTGDLDAHHWGTLGYRISLDDDEKWNLMPSFVVKMVGAIPPQVDLNAKLRYNDKFWFGTSYRYQDALIGMVGVTIKNKIDVAYAFDYSVGRTKQISTNSNEFMLGFRFPYHDVELPPAQFW